MPAYSGGWPTCSDASVERLQRLQSLFLTALVVLVVLLLSHRVHTTPLSTHNLQPHLRFFSLDTTPPHSHLATPVPLSFFHQRHRPLSLHLPASLPALLFRLHSKSAHHPRLARPPTCPPAFHTGLSKHISPTSLTQLSARSSSSLATSQASQQPWVTTTAHMAASFAA